MKLAAIALALLLGAAPARASTPDSTGITVYLLTMGPGREIWERFGHNAIWIQDRTDGSSIAYNYGMFDFAQKGFLLHFVQGRMWYWMAGFDAAPMIDFYRRSNRTIWAAELNLTGAQKKQLRDFLLWNSRPQNKYYFYDYYRDNCSTRVRDALDRVLGGTIRRQTESVAAGTTYRFETLRLTAAEPLIYTGLTAALGESTDRPLSAWEEMFLPLAFHRWIKKIKVTEPDGSVEPLVRSEQVLYASTDAPPPAAPPNWVPWYLAIGVVIGGGLLLLGRAARRSVRARTAFAIAAGTWALVAAITGVVLTGLWAFTDHVATYHNENLFLFNLLAVPLLVLVPRVTSSSPRVVRWAVLTATAVAVVAILGLVAKLLPGFDQRNAALLALAIPAHLGLAAGARAVQRTR